MHYFHVVMIILLTCKSLLSNCLFPECDGVLDIAFLLDSSGSIRSERFPALLLYVKTIVSQMEVTPDRTRIAMVTFSDQSNVQFYFDTYKYKEDVLQAIDMINFTPGRTNTAIGLQTLRTQVFNSARGDRFDAPNIAIIITDGNSNINAQDTIPQAIKARVDGMHIIVSTIENNVNNLEIKGMASEPNLKNIFNAQRYSDLPNLVNSITQATCDSMYNILSTLCLYPSVYSAKMVV